MKKESNFVLYAFLAIVVIGVGLYALLVPNPTIGVRPLPI